LDQRVGGLAHRRHRDHDLLALRLGARDALGDLADLVDVGDRRAAVLLHHDAGGLHGPDPSTACYAPRVRTLIVAALILCACPAPRPPIAPSGPDAPYALADEGDFELLRDRFWAMSPGRDRDDARRGMTGVLIGRARAHLTAGKQDLAHADL